MAIEQATGTCEQRPELLLHLSQCYPFSRLSGNRISEALDALRTYTLDPGEQLVLRAGTDSAYLYVIEGTVEVSQPDKDPLRLDFDTARVLAGQSGVVYMANFGFYFVAVTTLVCGAVFLMWLGEQITERGIGNGISLLIFAGIVAGLPGAIGSSLEIARSEGSWNLIPLLVIGVLGIATVAFVVFIERGQRRVTVNYAKRQVGNQMYAAQSNHLPLKVNMAGVIPPIFASSILLFPASIGQWFGSAEGMGLLQDLAQLLAPGAPLYILLFALSVVFFCFFYTALMFNPKEIAENLKKSGAFLPGIRPGEQTAKYIDGVVTRLTLFGALYITAVSLMPQFLQVAWDIPFYVGGTSLLIVVVVVMDFMAQLQSHLMSHQYQNQSLLKKANLKGYGRRR